MEFFGITEDELMKRKEEWEEIDALVADYKLQFNKDCSAEEKIKSEQATQALIKKFYPLFKKYLTILKNGQINFNNYEQRLFIVLFMDSVSLKRALYKKAPISKEYKQIIFQKFNFIRETYGYLEEDEILTDLYVLFLNLAKRYKPMARSFCCYVFNTFKYEVYRHIQAFTRNPLNIHYKTISYEDCAAQPSWEIEMNSYSIEDQLSTDKDGLPDIFWISGFNCAPCFQKLTPLERKIIIMYYLEQKNDRQISDEIGMHINTCNQKRRHAVKLIAEGLGIDESMIRRARNSGKKAQ
jgi:hypothetical protein